MSHNRIDETSADAEKLPTMNDTSSSSSSLSIASIQPEPIRTTDSRRIASRPSYEPVACDAYEHTSTPCAETDSKCEVHDPITRMRTGTSVTSIASRPPDFEVFFQDGDPDNPRNWSRWYRAWIIIAVSYSTWVIILHSTTYTAAIPGMMVEFGSSQTITTLGLTTYLFGLAFGSLIVAPLSELYGRQKVYLICLIAWVLLIIPCGLATSLTELIVVRFFGALFGAAMISNSPGTIVDITKPEHLSAAMSMWSIAPLNGPSTGPIIGGFVFQYMGWRWTNWIVLILGGVGVLMMLTVKETYQPTILKKKAARLRKEEDDPRWWCHYDQRVSTLQLFKTNMGRPFVLAATEPILWFMNFWISLIYAILYLCFVAYPIIFRQHRGWSASMSGLSFLGIGIGSMMAIFAEPLFRRLVNSQPRDPETGKVRPEATALAMAIGAILTPIGQLVFSWTSLNVHWAIPIAFGIPFGAGNTISFIYGSQYLAGTYGIYSASALAGNAVIRSIVGGVLPLAGPKMYAAMTPQWAGTLLGLLEVAMIPIPFVFWRYGARIRAKSPAVRSLREDQDKADAKRAKHQRALERQNRKQQQAVPDDKEDVEVGSVLETTNREV